MGWSAFNYAPSDTAGPNAEPDNSGVVADTGGQPDESPRLRTTVVISDDVSQCRLMYVMYQANTIQLVGKLRFRHERFKVGSHESLALSTLLATLAPVPRTIGVVDSEEPQIPTWH